MGTHSDDVELYELSTRWGDVRFRVTTEKERGPLDSIKKRGIPTDIRNLIRETEPGDTVYDLGANIGIYSCCIGVACPDITLVCVEPHPGSRERLKENLAENGIEAIVRPYMLMGCDDEVEISTSNENPGWMAGVNESTRSNRGVGEIVPARTLDSLIGEDEIPHPNIVKMDIEGYEFPVVSTATTLADDQTRYIQIEMHQQLIEKRGGTEDELLETLEADGFEIEFMSEGPRVYTLEAWKE